MTHEDAFDKLKHAAELVAEVTAHARTVMADRDMRGRWALRDAAQAIDRAQAAVARDMNGVRA